MRRWLWRALIGACVVAAVVDQAYAIRDVGRGRWHSPPDMRIYVFGLDPDL